MFSYLLLFVFCLVWCELTSCDEYLEMNECLSFNFHCFLHK